MKKIFLMAAAVLLAAGCASSASKTQDSNYAENAKYQIIDQEFDNMLAPEGNYDNVPPYEEQVNDSSYIQSVQKRGSNKPLRRAPATPVAANPAPITDEETLPRQ